MRRTAPWLLSASLWLGACSGGTAIESPPLTRHPVLAQPVEVVVQFGHDALVPGTDMDVGLVGVFSDYRCPANAVCGWQGSAVVGLHIALGSDPGTVFYLNTGVDPRSLALGHYLITVIGLTPPRTEGDSIPARKYQVELRVESI